MSIVLRKVHRHAGRCLAFAAGLLFLPLVGCLAIPSTAMMASKIGAASTPDGALSRIANSNDTSELPPKEGAAACIATAKELQANGHGQDAIVLYERAKKLDPSNRQVSRYLAVLYDQQGSDTRALAEYGKALGMTPRDADLLNDFGYYYYRRRDWQQAEKYLRQAIAQSADHERAWVNLGLALGEQERYQESYEAFAKVLGPASAHSNVGIILAAHQHRVEAEAAFRQALAIKPDMPQARSFLTHLEQGPSP